jgi:hypothetical protein
VNKAEFTMLGVVLVEYRDAVQMLDGCLTTAMDISQATNPDLAATIAACRLALLQGCEVVDGLLAEGRPRKES